MIRIDVRGLAACSVVLFALPLTVVGCSLNSEYGTSASAAPVKSPSSVPTKPFTSASGTWIFRNSYTLERLHLHQGKGGIVTGSGDAAVKDVATKGKVDHSSIDVHRGFFTKGKLTLTLYMTQIDWGTGLNLVEYLRCSGSARRLHCLMDAPLFTNVRNIHQDFSRS